MFRFILCGMFFVFNSVIYPQTPLVVNKLTTPVTFDGVPDETAWQAIPSLSMIMHTPVFGNEPTETSIIKIAYDDQYFYVSGFLNYKNPADMRATSRKRDYSEGTCDWFGIILDSFNDRKND